MGVQHNTMASMHVSFPAASGSIPSILQNILEEIIAEFLEEGGEWLENVERWQASAKKDILL